MYDRYKKFMKKYWKYALYTVAACTAIAVMVYGGGVLKREMEAAQAVQNQISENYAYNYSADENSSQETRSGADASFDGEAALPKPSATPKADNYLVTVYEGKIAVFKNDETKPMQTLDLPLSMLPEEDRRILEAGIHADGIGALKRILEDYQ